MPHTPYNSPHWQTPASIPPLHDRDLQVLRIDLPVSPSFLADCQSTLTTEESAHAARRKQLEDRQHAILGRGTLRLLLAANTNQTPSSVPITIDSNGKPQTPTLAFNVSHSGSIILIALQRYGSIGVDIERINPNIDIVEVATHSFTTTEATAIHNSASLFQLWARKESILKADGRGLLLPPNTFEATETVSILQPDSTTKTFRLHNIPIDNTYAAAIATDRQALTPTLFHYPTNPPSHLRNPTA